MCSLCAIGALLCHCANRNALQELGLVDSLTNAGIPAWYAIGESPERHVHSTIHSGVAASNRWGAFGTENTYTPVGFLGGETDFDASLERLLDNDFLSDSVRGVMRNRHMATIIFPGLNVIALVISKRGKLQQGA